MREVESPLKVPMPTTYTPKFTKQGTSYSPKFQPRPDKFLATQALAYILTQDGRRLKVADGTEYRRKFT